MEIKFKTAEISDSKKLLLLLSSRQDETNKLHGGNNNPVINSGKIVLKNMLEDENTTIIIGKRGEKIISIVTIYLLPRIRLGGYFAIIEDVLVDKEERGKGYGKQIMKHAIDLCKKDKRIKKIKLGTRKDSEHLHRFYENLGFEYKEKLMQLPLR